jgi:hypothetical protein
MEHSADNEPFLRTMSSSVTVSRSFFRRSAAGCPSARAQKSHGRSLPLIAQMMSALILAAAVVGNAAAQENGAALRAHLQQSYPSLVYVERYRESFPEETQGSDALWNATRPPELSSRDQLVRALAALEDQHVALAGPGAGPTETLGVLFRTSTDGHMIAWRVFDPAVTTIKPGDEIVSIDGRPTARWLQRAARVTFGGNRRSRAAEAALNLGAGARVVHEIAGLGPVVTLAVRSGSEAPRRVSLAYQPMGDSAAALMAAVVNAPDLPRAFESGGVRVGTLRLGAFAPQFDPAFTLANDAAAEIAGTTEDQAMLAGFCAVVSNFIASANEVAEKSDVIVLDLRGNMGGFGREARLLAAALTTNALPRSFDVFATPDAGVLQLSEEPVDRDCGHIANPRPMIVLTDAGTRSAGELMAAWLWGAGLTVVGERTIGAGGGFEFGSAGFVLPRSNYTVRTSGNFTLFDMSGALSAGSMSETAMVEIVAEDHFAPSRRRPFAIQAAGLRPDLAVASTLADLRDGGRALIGRVLEELRIRGISGL